MQAYINQLPPFPADLLAYQSWRGNTEFREALAGMLQYTFMSGVAVDPNHITVAAGAGAIIDLLFYCVCSAGDAVMILAPYYPAFDNDLQVIMTCQHQPYLCQGSSPHVAGHSILLAPAPRK